MSDAASKFCCLIAAAALSIACESSSPTTPAPPPPPVPEPTQAALTTYRGTVKIVGASPVGNCAADAITDDTGRAWVLTVALPDRVGSYDGHYTADLLQVTECHLKLSSARSDFFDVELYPYCDAAVSDWTYGQSCTPADGWFVGSSMRLPAPAADAIRGEGTIIVSMGPAPLAGVEIAVRFDLTRL